MSWEGTPTTLFRAMKLPNGQVVCVDPRVISLTTKVVRHSQDYYASIEEGWCDEPAEALAQFERYEEQLGQMAAERAASDLRMSEAAQRESADYEKTVSAHVPVIPEAHR